MVTQAIHSWNTVLGRATPGYVAIAEITNITGPEKTLNAVDVTHLTSPNTYKEFIGGLRDGGEVGVEGNFFPGDTAGQIGISGDLDGATVQDFRITFPDGTTWTFKALVTKFGTGAPLDDKLPFSATMKITAKPVLGVTATADATVFVLTQSFGPGAVTGVPTPFAGATYTYSYVVNTAATWVTINITQGIATSVITVHNSVTGITQTLQSTVESGNLALHLLADTLSVLTIMCRDLGAVAKYYTIHIVRP